MSREVWLARTSNQVLQTTASSSISTQQPQETPSPEGWAGVRIDTRLKCAGRRACAPAPYVGSIDTRETNPASAPITRSFSGVENVVQLQR